MKSLLITILLIASIQNSEAQYALHKDWSEDYLEANSVDIESVRETVDLLTNYWRGNSEGVILTKRRKAVVRHVKHLSEKLEFHVLSGDPVNDTTTSYLKELDWIKQSYLNKSTQAMNPDVTFGDKVDMLGATWTSPIRMKYKDTEQNLRNDSSFLFCDSMTAQPYKRFGLLADEKKIDRDKNMVVVFKGLSQYGSAPKIKTWDLDFDNQWNLKWGDEVHADVVGSRLFAALGYDVDHPYYYGKDKLTLVLHKRGKVKTWDQLRDSIQKIYQVDLTPFLSQVRIIDTEMIEENDKLEDYEGQMSVTFIKCAIEARPDRVKRLGSFSPDSDRIVNNRDARASLLAHVWIGNWDLREENTLLTTVHEGNYKYHVSPVFADLGASFGVKLSPLSGDFKVGLVNEFEWEAASRKGGKVKLSGRINEWLDPYKETSYQDLRWMAERIAEIDGRDLRKILKKSGWPDEVQTLYYHKLASRRASILEAFQVVDPNPMAFDKQLNIAKDGIEVVKNGKLMVDYENHPESLLNTKGRKRNYGN